MGSTLPILLLLSIPYVSSVLLNGKYSTPVPPSTQDPLVHSGLNGIVEMVQEFGSLKTEVERQEQTNKLLELKVSRLEQLLNQLNNSALQDASYLAQTTKVEGEIATLTRTTEMIETEMNHVVSTASLLEMEMLRVQRSMNDVSDCQKTFTNKLENLTSVLTVATQSAVNLENETSMLNETHSEIYEQLSQLNINTANVQTTIDRVADMKCESGRLYFENNWPKKLQVVFDHPFSRTPTISYGVVGVESDTRNSDMSYELTISDVKSSGFQLECSSKSSSYLHKVDVQWMACLV